MYDFYSRWCSLLATGIPEISDFPIRLPNFFPSWHGNDKSTKQKSIHVIWGRYKRRTNKQANAVLRMLSIKYWKKFKFTAVWRDKEWKRKKRIKSKCIWRIMLHERTLNPETDRATCRRDYWGIIYRLMYACLYVLAANVVDFFFDIDCHTTICQNGCAKNQHTSRFCFHFISFRFLHTRIDCSVSSWKLSAFSMWPFDVCNTQLVLQWLTHQYLWFHLNLLCQMARVQFVCRRSHTQSKHIPLYAKCLIELFRGILYFIAVWKHTSVHTRTVRVGWLA